MRKCARALPGQRAYAQKPNRKGKNVSVIGAISLKGLLTQWSGLGSIDALTFDAFISLSSRTSALAWRSRSNG
ncbi:hypothetical protein [Nostoc sp.]|uniref:hypothetical protein n=1 Tax=Nostoc sp. TaxID=1180 RepID=UPI003FA5F808